MSIPAIPTVGRIVHVYNQDLKDFGSVGPYPAIVTRVNSDGSIDAEVFPTKRTGGFYENVPWVDRKGGDNAFIWWVWPPHVPRD